MAVVTAAVNNPQFIKLHNKRVIVKVFDHRSHHIDRLRQSIALFDWSDVTSATDITDMYNRFLAALSQLVHDNIPVNTVKLGVHDPAFVTPLIKELLRKRNKLRHKGKLSQANELAEKINSLIVLERSRTMTRLADAKPKQLWAAVKPTVSSKYSSSLITDNPLLVNVDIVNDFFASISYDCNSGSGYSLPTNFVHNESDVPIRDYELEPNLRKIKPTAPGLDALPIVGYSPMFL